MPKLEEKAWFVRHPAHGLTVVKGKNEEEASIAAAELWGVPWAQATGGMTFQRAPENKPRVCKGCGKTVFGDAVRCGACQKKYEGAMNKPSWGERQLKRAARLEAQRQARMKKGARA